MLALAALVVAVARVVQTMRDRRALDEPPADWPPLRETVGAAADRDGADPGAGSGRPTAEGWVEPDGDGACPTSHPVKAKLSSKIFHVPGGASYERTKADRCYGSTKAAESDGLRQSKR